MSNRTAIAYIRVSTDRQELGPEAQRAQIAMWALRENVTIAAWFTDAGISGAAAIDERPGLLAALSALRSNRAGILVAARRDRIARDPVIAALVGAQAVRARAVLLTADGASDATGPEGVMLKGIHDVFSAYELAIIKARTKAALAVKKARGERTGGDLPYGCALAVDGRTLIPNAAEQRIVDRIASMRTGGMSTRAIAADLESAGIVSRTGKPFGKSQVARILARNTPLPAAAAISRAA